MPKPSTTHASARQSVKPEEGSAERPSPSIAQAVVPQDSPSINASARHGHKLTVLERKVDSFIKSTGAAPASQSITGLGFKPKVIILWGTRLTSDGLAVGSMHLGAGFASSPSDQYSQGITKTDGPGAGSDAGRVSNGSCFQWSDDAFNVPPLAEAELVSFDDDGFTLNWTTNEARADIIHYLALGGSEVTGAKVGSVLSLASGDQDIVTDFQPDGLIILSNHLATYDQSSTPGSGFGVGFCDDDLNQRATHLFVATVGAGVLNVRSQVSGIVARWSGTGASGEGTITSMLSDGFRINWGASSTPRIFGYLALRGPRFHVGDDDKPTATGQVATTGINFEPLALFALSYCDGVTFQKDLAFPLLTIGAGDGVTEGCTWIGYDRAGQVNSAQATDRTKILQMLEFPPYALPPDGEADLLSLDTSGFNLDWPVADATARKFLYLAIGESPPLVGAPAEAHLDAVPEVGSAEKPVIPSGARSARVPGKPSGGSAGEATPPVAGGKADQAPPPGSAR